MNVRSTPQLNSNFAVTQLQAQSTRLLQVQQQLSTGVRLHKPSDDPLATRNSLIQQDRISRLDTYLSSVAHAESRLSQAHVQLRSASDLFVQAREVALSARQATDQAERNAYASELDGVLQQLVSITNAQDETGYLFAGTATRTRPFAVSSDGSGVTYTGTPAPTELHLSDDVQRNALVPGDQIFMGTLRESTVVVGSTGIAPGLGVDTATGLRTLVVENTGTTYAAGGVTAGASAASGDTIVGATGSHTLQIDDTSGTGASGTISLDGGPSIAFTSADTDLQLTGPFGETVFVDTTAITPGFSGSVDITASGSVSIDDGATQTALDFTANQQIVDSRDGTIIHLDSSAPMRTGTDRVEMPGTSNAFQVLIGLRDELRNPAGKSDTELSDALGFRIDELERMSDHLLNEIGVQSVSLEQLSHLHTRTEDSRLEQIAELADTTNADLAAVAVELQELLNLQQFTMATVGQLMQPNLLQFLQ